MLNKNQLFFRFIFLFGLIFSLTFTSCEDKEDVPTPNPTEVTEEQEPEPTEETDPQTTEEETIAKKWVVSSTSNTRIKNNESDFVWFEFTKEGYFIILKNDSNTLTGIYTQEGNTIHLAGVGTLVVSDMDARNFSFTFTAEGSTESISIFTNEADKVVEKTTRTELLCRTWSIKRQHGLMSGISIDQSYPNEFTTEYTAVFSVYGTYVLWMTDFTGSKQVFNRLWKWKDSEETMICYGTESSDCNGENETTVLDLTETSFNLHTVIPSKSVDFYDELVAYEK